MTDFEIIMFHEKRELEAEIERLKERERELVELIKTAQPIVLSDGHGNLSRLMRQAIKTQENEAE